MDLTILMSNKAREDAGFRGEDSSWCRPAVCVWTAHLRTALWCAAERSLNPDVFLTGVLDDITDQAHEDATLEDAG